jgi:NADH-quinone oxidoreductase subunit G
VSDPSNRPSEGSVPVRAPKLAVVPPITASAVGTPAPPSAPSNETVTLSIDGREVTARKGQWIIDAADDAGVYIPRFCYHPRMKPVGMCRMCLVEVAGPRGSSLMPACYNPVADGMQISTQSALTKKAQDGVLEFLLVNHPLDCPVCDKGGECPLQDQTLAYGPGETRFVEEKRHWDKPIPISDLVYLDRERCIQCGRCVRFADEVAGDPLIDFAQRSDMTEVATFPDEPYSSYFSGNVVQICPVGALTAKPYRFRARPWDLEQVESSCTSCSVGCRVAVQSSSDELTRYIGVDSDPVNWAWLCDKGRFDFQAIESPERLTVPLIRRGDEFVEASWAEALAAAAAGLASARDTGGGPSLAVIGGARLPNEDAYAWSKLARVGLETDNVDVQLGDGLPAPLVLGLPRATIDEAAAAPLVITLGPDIKDELPVLYLRLRAAVQDQGLQLVELAPQRGGMSRYAASAVQYRPGEVADLVAALAGNAPLDGPVAGVAAEAIADIRAHITRAWEKGRPGRPQIVVVLGRPSLAEPDTQIAEAAAILAGLPGVAFLSALRRSNVHGALDMGLAPGVLPGRVSLDEGRAWFERQWAPALRRGESGSVALPAGAGLDTAGILAAAARGHIGGLVLLGADPLTDFPDSTAAIKGLSGARFVVAVDTHLNRSTRRADVILPAATYSERRGTFTNLEGRITWLGQLVTAPGVAWPDWMIATELAARLGVDLGFTSLEEIWAEVTRVSPLHHGVGHDVISGRQGRDGVVAPLDPGATPTRPRPLDPMADPGIASAELHSLAFASLAGVGAHPPASANDGVDAPGVFDVEDIAPPPPSRLGPPPPPVGRAVLDAARPGELRLVARRPLWDGGTLVQHSPSLANLHPPRHVAAHPDDLARLGVAEGATVRVSSPRGHLDLPVRAEAGLARGSVAIAFNLPGVSAATLIDADAAVTTVGLDSLEEDPVSHG